MRCLKSLFHKHKQQVILTLLVYMFFYIFQLLSTGKFSTPFDIRLASSALLLVLTSLIFATPKKFYISLLLVVLTIGSLILVKLYIDTSLEYILFNRTLGYIIGITNLTLIFSAILARHTASKLFIFPLFLTILAPIVFIWAYYLTSGAWINTDTVLAVLQTNVDEAIEYIVQFATLESILAISLFILVLCFIPPIFLYQLKLIRLTKITAALLFICLIGNIVLVYKCRDNLITSVFHEAKRFTKTYEEFNQFKDIRKSNLNLSGIPNQGIYVLVIGESHSRDFTSAYGYKTDTTPWLNTISKNNNTILLENAFSCHIQTTPTVTYALTSKNQYNSVDLKNSVSLLEVVEKANFDTVWVSNQSKFGFNDTPITVIADEANQQLWINGTKLRTEQKPFDGEILNYIPKIQLSDNMLIIIHMMGSHAAYNHRYPKNFNIFLGNTPITEYNNSLRYTDHVIENIYNNFKKLPNFKAMVYFSDHGEKPGVGHDTSNFDKCMSHIPTLFTFSDSYVKEHSNIFYTLHKNKDYIFTNDLIFNTILGIMGITVENISEPYNNLSSETYDSNPKRFTTMYGKVKIID